MRINKSVSDYSKYQNQPQKTQVKTTEPAQPCAVGYNYPAVYFCGKISHGYVKKSTEPFIKVLDDILKNDVTERELSKEELLLKELDRVIAHMLRIKKQEEKIVEQLSALSEMPISNPQLYLNERNRILKEAKKVYKSRFELPKVNKKEKVEDTKTDFILINKFKSAVLEENFDLTRVFKTHYSGISEATSVKELKAKYPKLTVPKDPREVIAGKIEGCLTRGFYEDLDALFLDGDSNSARELCTINIKNIINEATKNCSEKEKEEIFEKVKISVGKNIIEKYKRLRKDDSFSIVPMVRKIKPGLISETDRKMLSVDYDRFSLSVLRKQYLELEKPNNISYTEGNITIKCSELKGTDYKIEKIPEKITSILRSGEEYKANQRDYDNFTAEDFQQRLDFIADRLDSDEYFLKELVDFSTCRFEQEDINALKSFLRESDKVLDGEQTMKDAVQNIHKNNIRPKGTEKVNEMERKARMDKIRQENKRLAELNRIQTRFDDEVNILYQNDMAYVAELCGDYRPKTLTDDKTKVNELYGIISKYKDKDNPQKLVNKDKLATEITRWNKFYQYNEIDPDCALVSKAKKYALKENGEVDYNKAGKYILNAEAVEYYPQSFEYARNREAAESIMEHFKSDKESAIEYLCKYDDYLDLNKSEKSKISNILDIFDVKNSYDKTLLKSIIENEYVNVPTKDYTIDEEKGKKVLSTITPKAKQEILDYYKYPQCLDYFRAFEDALKIFAPPRGVSGVKSLGKNNKNFKDVYELKIKMSSDRLMCYDGSYCFDKLDHAGMH